MTNLTTPRRSFLFALLGTGLFALASFSTTSILESILQKLERYQAVHSQEKLYLHLDKPFYAAGDNIWFKAYLVDASIHNLDSQSRVMYVDVSNENKEVIFKKFLYVESGITFGDFKLPDSLTQGTYLIRAYTNHMRNAGEDFFFMKEISVLANKRKTDPEPSTFLKDSVDLQFFPEGGNLVASGAFNRVAFKAAGPDGKSIAVEGNIFDEHNNLVVSFKSQHDGMGVVNINPVADKSYYAVISNSNNQSVNYPLPKVREAGYSMQVGSSGDNLKLLVFGNVEKSSATEGETIYAVIQSHGKIYFALEGVVRNKAFFTYIPKSKFPDGISQITLFDSKGHPVAERLVCQNKNDNLVVSVKADTTVYGNRQKVNLFIQARYKNGMPAEANFSVSVYDMDLLPEKEQYPLTITNYLSLTSDLRGHIANPGYYFKDSLPETRNHLDLLMMVHGWRRFTWNDVLAENPAEQKFQHEKGIPLSGKVLRPMGKKAATSSVLKILMNDGNAFVINPDSAGRFYTDNLMYYDSMSMVIQTEDQKGNKQLYKLHLDPFNPTPEIPYALKEIKPVHASEYLELQGEEILKEKQLKANILPTLMVKERKNQIDSRKISMNSYTLDVSKFGKGYLNALQMLQGRAPGVMISGSPTNLDVKVRGRTPLYTVNGVMMPKDFVVNAINPSDVEAIEVVSGGAASIYNATAIINIVMKKGGWTSETTAMNPIKYPGFYQARQFYEPRYDVADPKHSEPDNRTTLFWYPVVVTNELGESSLSFFTGDLDSHYRIVLEGLTQDGYAGNTSSTFVVE